jgi:pyridoxamine 5'-phosphate oxidase
MKQAVTDNLPLTNLRREYTLAGLRRAELDADPIAQFGKWLQQAVAAGIPEPNAMTLATADKQGRPSARTVLLKGADERGFVFFTNYESRKGRELEWNPNAALVFFWPGLERQVCVAGTVAKVPPAESKSYFDSRPKGSRLAALASEQSQPIPDRGFLEKRLATLFAKYPGEEIPVPAAWGGFRLAPDRIEFWQGRPSRLHDRFEYLKLLDNRWQIERLAP